MSCLLRMSSSSCRTSLQTHEVMAFYLLVSDGIRQRYNTPALEYKLHFKRDSEIQTGSR